MPKRAARPLDLGFDSEPSETPSLTRLFAASTAKESEMQRATMLELDHLADNPFQPRLEGRQCRHPVVGLRQLCGRRLVLWQ